eukprot:8660058-Pyramimonas_sp.AAC.1
MAAGVRARCGRATTALLTVLRFFVRVLPPPPDPGSGRCTVFTPGVFARFRAPGPSQIDQARDIHRKIWSRAGRAMSRCCELFTTSGLRAIPHPPPYFFLL